MEKEQVKGMVLRREIRREEVKTPGFKQSGQFVKEEVRLCDVSRSFCLRDVPIIKCKRVNQSI